MAHWKRTCVLFLCASLAFSWSLQTDRGLHAADEATDPDEELLRQNGVAADNAKLIEFLRQRSANDDDLLHLNQLVRQLGDVNGESRDQASAKLVRVGLAALPRLRDAAHSTDTEMARRAQACVEEIRKESQVNLPLAAVRVLLRRQPADLDVALLRYLPYCVDQEVEEEIWYGLDVLAVRDANVHPKLAISLQDRVPERRALAACILGRLGNAEQRDKVRKLLTDPNALVRLRSAQGLLAGDDKSSVPHLIALLQTPRLTLAWQAEELLHWVAGGSAPPITLGAGGVDERRKCQAAWEQWWKKHEPQVDFQEIKRQPRCPSLVLIHDQDAPGKELGHVWLCGCNGRPRWQLSNLIHPAAIHLTSEDRLLVGEALPGVQITERDLDGRVHRAYQLEARGAPTTLRRGADGTLFVAAWFWWTEIDLNGERQHFNDRFRDDARLRPLDKLPNGRVLCVSEEINALHELDLASAKVMKTVPLDWKTTPGRIWTSLRLSRGHYLVADLATNSVFEVNGAGKTIWKYSPRRLITATRLPNGNTLVACGETSQERLVEVDHRGKAVLETFPQGTMSPTARVQSCLRLVRLGFRPPPDPDINVDSLDHQLKLLKATEVISRRRGAVSLAMADSKLPETATAALVNGLADSDAEVRQYVLIALAKRTNASALPVLTKGLGSDNELMRAGVLPLLARYRQADNSIPPKIIAALKDKSPYVRLQATFWVRQLGSEAKPAVPDLIEALKDKYQDPHNGQRICDVAADTLAVIGADAKEAKGAILQVLLDSRDQDLQCSVALALGAIAPGDLKVVEALCQALVQKRSVPLSIAAARALDVMGTKAKQSVPQLIEALTITSADRSLESYLKRVVLSAIARMGPDGKQAVPPIVSILRNPSADSTVREWAARALGEIAAPSEEVRAVLEAVIARDNPNSDPEGKVREASIQALKKILSERK